LLVNKIKECTFATKARRAIVISYCSSSSCWSVNIIFQLGKKGVKRGENFEDFARDKNGNEKFVRIQRYTDVMILACFSIRK